MSTTTTMTMNELDIEGLNESSRTVRLVQPARVHASLNENASFTAALCRALRQISPKDLLDAWPEILEAQLESRLTVKGRKRLLERAGPALLCLTFIDDGLRIPLYFNEQHNYMVQHMRMYAWFATLVLMTSSVVQLAATWLLLRPSSFQPSRVKLASYMLLAFTGLQPFVYGQTTDVDFICRSSTVAGGLLLLLWGENERVSRHKGLELNAVNQSSADRLQLAGRMLLTFLFLFQAIRGEQGGLKSVLDAPSIVNVASLLGLVVLSLMVCVGFKTDWSSLILATILSVANFWMYPFWSVDREMTDFVRYYFFQTCSIVGGLLLLTLHGPGGLSLDGQKKHA